LLGRPDQDQWKHTKSTSFAWGKEKKKGETTGVFSCLIADEATMAGTEKKEEELRENSSTNRKWDVTSRRGPW